jgi:hypothetical protein
MSPSLVPVMFRRLLLPILVLAAAVSASAQTLVTFTFAGTANSTAGGYTSGDPMNITFVMSTASTPSGGTNVNYFYWVRSNSVNPSASLFSSVAATGLTGTWNGTDSTSVVTDDEIVINTGTSPATLAFQSDASNGNLRLFTPDTHAVTFILIQGEWNGLNLANISSADPVAYFAARTGTYSFVPASYGFDYLDYTGGGSVTFMPVTLTITAAAIPEPATEAMFAGLGVLSLALVRRRRQA